MIYFNSIARIVLFKSEHSHINHALQYYLSILPCCDVASRNYNVAQRCFDVLEIDCFPQLHHANFVTARHRHGNAEINVFVFTATSLYEETTDPCPYYQQCLKRALVLSHNFFTTL